MTGGIDGWTGNVANSLDSTEIFTGTEWTTVGGKLPRAMYYMQVATINSRILAFGKYDKTVYRVAHLFDIL